MQKMSLTKLGSDLIKQAFFNPSLAIKGIGAGFNLFKKNIVPALQTVRTNLPKAYVAGRNSITGAAGTPRYLNKFRNVGPAFNNAGKALKSGLSTDQIKALSYGAKGVGIAGAVGIGAHMGNKDYKNTMADLNKWKQYRLEEQNRPIEY